MLSSTISSAILLLTSANNRACSKTFSVKGGKPTVESYGKEVRWNASVHDAGTLQALEDLLRSVEGKNVIAVVGALLEEDQRDHILRRMYDPGATIKMAERSWLPIDIDDVEVPGDDPETRLYNLIRARLPRGFYKAGYIAQFTSSYGLKGGLNTMRCRLWFMLDRPIRPDAWRYLFRGVDGIDPCIYSPNQPIYIVPPRFDGLRDPIGSERIIRYDGPPVVTKTLPLGKALKTARAAAQVPKAVRLDVEPDEVQIAETVERILGQTPKAGRHHWALGAACELYAIGADPKLIMDTFEECLRIHGRDPDPGEAKRAVEYAARKARTGELRSSTLPTAQVLPDIPAGPAEPQFEDEVAEEGEDAIDEFAQLDHVLHKEHSDAKNANIFVRENFGDGGYIKWMEDEFVFEGFRWRRLETKKALPGLVRRFGLDLTKAKKDSCVDAIRDLGDREGLSMPCWLTDDLGMDPDGDTVHTVVLQNGILDIRDTIFDKESCLRPHSRRFFSTACLPFAYDPKAECPLWEAALQEWFPQDTQALRELQKMFGYLITTDTSQQKFFMFAGESRAGKGVLCSVIDHMLGGASAGGLLASFGEPFALYELLGKNLCFLNESNAQKAKDLPAIIVDRIKAISGEDKVDVNGKNKQHVHTKLSTRLVLVCNQMPKMDDLSSAITNRMVLFHFKNSFAGREDPTLKDKLYREIAGIFNWAVEGYRMLVEDGRFNDVLSSVDQKAEIRAAASPPRAFLLECTHPAGLDVPPIITDDLYATFRRWCDDQGLEHSAPKNTFMRALRAVYPHVEVTASKGWNRPGHVAGVTLNPVGDMFNPKLLRDWIDKPD